MRDVEPGLVAHMCGRAAKRLALGLRSPPQRRVPIMPTSVGDRGNPPKIECVLRYLELTHRRGSQLIFCQELRLVVSHERQQPIAASVPLLGKSLREFVFSALLRDIAHATPCDPVTALAFSSTIVVVLVNKGAILLLQMFAICSNGINRSVGIAPRLVQQSYEHFRLPGRDARAAHCPSSGVTTGG